MKDGTCLKKVINIVKHQSVLKLIWKKKMKLVQFHIQYFN